MSQVELLTLWVSLLAVGALLIRVGQALAAVGAARSKNAASAISRNLFDFSISLLIFSFIGIHLLTDGTVARRVLQVAVPLNFNALTLHFAAMALIGSGLIAPAVSERSRWRVPLVGSLLMSAVFFPLFGRWVWYGWLGRAGFVDNGGAVPIHLAGALCAMVAAYWVGPRMGKYNHDGSTSMIPSHQGAMPGVGLLLIIAGWLPSVMGSALLRESDGGAAAVAAAGINALVASAAGGVGAAISVKLRYPRVELSALCGGLLGGAVAMTAACGAIAPWEAAILGLVAGSLTPVASQWLDFKCRIDDPVGVIAPHGVGAVVAVLGAALFSPNGMAARFATLGVQCLGLGCVAVATIAASWIVFAALQRIWGLRVNEGDEFDGLDLSQHDVNAYPDFQQTMIKSYHMREA